MREEEDGEKMLSNQTLGLKMQIGIGFKYCPDGKFTFILLPKSDPIKNFDKTL